MGLFKKRGSCEEAMCIVKYVNDRIDGKESQMPAINYGLHQTVYDLFDKLLNNEEIMAKSSKELLNLVSQMSVFDVNMSHISYKLIDFAKEIATLSESNLAIVEETTASMSQVAEAVNESAEILDELSASSEKFLDSNNESLKQISEINTLKENVMNDSSVMNSQIEKLVEMANKVNEIVGSVGEIAEQTNLLALNASIEAARAGEHGKGFSVVASEIRKLADDTKKSLEGMSSFVENIKEAAANGQNSVKNTLESTSNMSSKIDTISLTMQNNMELLSKTIEDVKTVNSAMSGVKVSADEISIAMDSSSKDAEKLSYMTQTIQNDAQESAEFAKQISDMDNALSEIVKNMLGNLHGSANAMTNEELKQNITKAKAAHSKWMTVLKSIVDENKLYPLQTNSTKCAFGHFYHSIKIKHPSIKDDWCAINEVHNNFHKCGDKVMDAIKSTQKAEALKHYQEAEHLSKQIFSLLEKVENEIEVQTQKGVKLFA